MSSPSASELSKAQLVLEKAKLSKAQNKKKSGSKAAAPKAVNTSNKENEGITETKIPHNWAKNPKHNDQLLTIIEANERYRRAFGFAHGQGSAPTSGGLTVAKVAQKIARELFPNSSVDDEKLGISVKNRVASIKKAYLTYKSKLGETGHGLIIDGKEDKIVEGTGIYNVHDKIRKKFKCYKRLHELLTASPVYDSSAVANSMTHLNLSILTSSSGAPQDSSAAACPDSDCDVPTQDPANIDPNTRASTTVPMCLPDPSLPSLSVPVIQRTPSLENAQALASPAPGSLKRKVDLFQQLVDAHRTLSNARAESKRQHIELKEEKRMKLKQVCIEEAKRQRKHEVDMMEKQMMLAQFKAGSAPLNSDTNSFGGFSLFEM
ncbi:hypothetical protein EST38_g12534 [Candolleomyces aberdarensis]|uniref:Uncharacterized protein n=1 Tax=Candolleomyces aberdarensis TaxID=2316362 RepID=A0A4Q2D2Y8_9AGAR|nr:hypothetical protein EST38_g12534 [Candolleomyces aberdarensis]